MTTKSVVWRTARVLESFGAVSIITDIHLAQWTNHVMTVSFLRTKRKDKGATGFELCTEHLVWWVSNSYKVNIRRERSISLEQARDRSRSVFLTSNNGVQRVDGFTWRLQNRVTIVASVYIGISYTPALLYLMLVRCYWSHLYGELQITCYLCLETYY